MFVYKAKATPIDYKMVWNENIWSKTLMPFYDS